MWWVTSIIVSRQLKCKESRKFVACWQVQCQQQHGNKKMPSQGPQHVQETRRLECKRPSGPKEGSVSDRALDLLLSPTLDYYRQGHRQTDQIHLFFCLFFVNCKQGHRTERAASTVSDIWWRPPYQNKEFKKKHGIMSRFTRPPWLVPIASQDLLDLLPGAQSFLIRTRWALWRVRSQIPNL